MTHSFKNSFFLLVLAVCFQSCIGTDLIDEPLGTDLSRVELSVAQISLEVGQTQQLQASYFDFSGEEVSGNLSWKSNDVNVASVTETGLVTAVGGGQTNITATAENGKTATTLVNIVANANEVASIEISANSTEILQVDETLQLTAIVRNVNGEIIDNEEISWESEQATIATVDANGLVTARQAGTANITASAANIKSINFVIDVAGTIQARSGTFEGLTGHRVSGSAMINQEGGGAVVRLGDDFRTQSGPALHLYFSKDPDGKDYIDLGDLQKTSGSQAYTVPENINAEEYTYVLVWCEPFGINFGRAELR